MNTVCPTDQCTACGACQVSCEKKAIKIEDKITSCNAVINKEICVNCGRCYQVCQVNHPLPLIKPKTWYQGWAKSEQIRRRSSSGGAAAVLTRVFLSEYGSVCSCCYENGIFQFQLVDSVEDAYKFAGSKYVKSNPTEVYKIIKNKLKASESVLFIGLPCQVAAVKRYVGEVLGEKLFTCDLICHGTPSPKLLDQVLCNHKYLDRIEFRRKTDFRILVNEKPLMPEGVQDYYTMAFLKGISYTENCYSCQYARLERCSDITLGDSWGSELSEQEQNKGISLILCQTEKGVELVDQSNLELFPVHTEKAVGANKQLQMPTQRPEGREYFLKSISKGNSLKKALFVSMPMSTVKVMLKSVLTRLNVYYFVRSIRRRIEQ